MKVQFPSSRSITRRKKRNKRAGPLPAAHGQLFLVLDARLGHPRVDQHDFCATHRAGSLAGLVSGFKNSRAAPYWISRARADPYCYGESDIFHNNKYIALRHPSRGQMRKLVAGGVARACWPVCAKRPSVLYSAWRRSPHYRARRSLALWSWNSCGFGGIDAV